MADTPMFQMSDIRTDSNIPMANTPAQAPMQQIQTPDSLQRKSAENIAATGVANEQIQVQDQGAKDTATFDALVKSGIGDLHSPEGIKALMESDQFNASVSEQGKNHIRDLYGKKVSSQLQIDETLSKLDAEKSGALMEETTWGRDNLLKPVADAYHNTLEQTGSVKAAEQAMKEENTRRIEMASKLTDRNGKPKYTPEHLQSMAKLGIDEIDHAMGATDYFLSRATASAKLKEQESKGNKEQAMADQLKAGGKEMAMYKAADDKVKSGEWTQQQADSFLAQNKKGSGSNAPSMLSPDALEAAMYDKLINHIDPPKRGEVWGQVEGEMAKLAKDLGKSLPELFAMSAEAKAKIMANRTVETKILNLSRSEEQLKQEIPTMKAAMDKLAPSNQPKWANMQMETIRQVGTDEQKAALTTLEASATAVFDEFQSIMDANPGALHEGELAQAKDGYKKANTPVTMNAWIKNAEQMIDRAHKGNTEYERKFKEGISKPFERTNNPGNMRPSGSSTGFQKYGTPEAGLAAIDKNLKSYGDKGVNTISSVISRWAPPSENDTKSYIADVSKRLGIPPDQKLDMNDPVVRQALSTAISIHENGSSKLFGTKKGSNKQYSDADKESRYQEWKKTHAS